MYLMTNHRFGCREIGQINSPKVKFIGTRHKSRSGDDWRQNSGKEIDLPIVMLSELEAHEIFALCQLGPRFLCCIIAQPE
jgi:hypothetical protein